MTTTLDDLEILAWRVIGFDQASAVNMWEERNDRNAEMGWDLDGALEKRFGCDFSGFCNLVEKLLPLAAPGAGHERRSDTIGAL